MREWGQNVIGCAERLGVWGSARANPNPEPEAEAEAEAEAGARTCSAAEDPLSM